MKIVLSPTGPQSYLHSMMVLAKVLQDRGHWVWICAPEQFRSRIYEAGYPMVSSGPTYKEYLEGTGEDRDFCGELGGLLAKDAAMHFVALRDALRGADAYVGSMLQIAGPSVAEQYGVTCFTAIFSPIHLNAGEFPAAGVIQENSAGIFASVRQSKRRSEWENLLLKSINRERNLGHQAPVRDLYRYMFDSGRRLVALDKSFLKPEESGTQTVTGFWCEDEPGLAGELESFISSGPQPVFLDWIPVRSEMEFVNTFCRSMLTTGHRVVLGPGWTLEAQDLPDGCKIMEARPFGSLLSRMAAVVHRGNHEIVAHSVRAGIPQVTVPFMREHHDWALRLQKAGICPAPVASRDAESLSAFVRQVLADQTLQQRCREYAGENRSVNGVSSAADAILEEVQRIKGA